MKKKFIIPTIVLLLLSLAYVFCFKIWSSKEANYEFIGKFDYVIRNEELFNKTYMSENSYGFLIGHLPIQGIEIRNADQVDKGKDYIFSFKHPVKAVYVNSKYVRSEGQEHLKKKPVEIIQDRSIDQDYIFVYLLKPNGKYRLLLP